MGINQRDHQKPDHLNLTTSSQPLQLNQIHLSTWHPPPLLSQSLAAAVKAAAPARRRPPAHVASSRPSTATVRRLRLITRLLALAARASNSPLVPAPAPAPRRRTPSPLVPPVPVAREHPTLAPAAELRLARRRSWRPTSPPRLPALEHIIRRLL